MSTKFGIILGLGIGYVLGTRAGRGQYDKLRAHASRLRQVPLVARPLDAAAEKVSEAIRIQGEVVTDKVADAIKERLFGAPATPTHSTATQPSPTHSSPGANEVEIVEIVDLPSSSSR